MVKFLRSVARSVRLLLLRNIQAEKLCDSVKPPGRVVAGHIVRLSSLTYMRACEQSESSRAAVRVIDEQAFA